MPAALAPDSLLVRPGRELLGPGGWDGVFGRRAPREVEVGFGRDDGLLRRAKADPGRDFVGIELKADRVRTYVGRAARLGLRNLRVVPGRAESVVGVLLPDGFAATVRVLFPDPWPKDRHASHRLVQPWFVRELRRVLEPGGLLLLATDDAPYGEQMREAVATAGGFEGAPEDSSGTRWEPDPGVTIDGREAFDGTTIFERRGLAEGRPIARLALRRLP
jgi:tRNA (guanine-N7-)-methyltransferase